MSKKTGLRFGKTRPQLDAVTGATVPRATNGVSAPVYGDEKELSFAEQIF